MQKNKKEINLKLTVETTLDKFKGWSLGKYLSSKIPGVNIRIDARYPGEKIPGNSLRFTQPDYSAKPDWVSIRRGKTEVTLYRDAFHDNVGKEKNAYVLTIHTADKDYRAIEMPDGTFLEQGNPLLLWAIQRDKELSSYINCVNKNDKASQKVVPSQLDLNQIMTHNRPVTR